MFRQVPENCVGQLGFLSAPTAASAASRTQGFSPRRAVDAISLPSTVVDAFATESCTYGTATAPQYSFWGTEHPARLTQRTKSQARELVFDTARGFKSKGERAGP
jgi:hypothetical protein